MTTARLGRGVVAVAAVGAVGAGGWRSGQMAMAVNASSAVS